MTSRIIRPKSKLHLDRRSFLRGSLAAAGSLTLAGCDNLPNTSWFKSVLEAGEALTLKVQRALIGPGAMAREFTEADISPDFKANGSTQVDDAGYQALAASDFKDFRLEIGGLVNNEIELSLDELRAMPARTQITRHDCVEGWSSIGKWTGVPLKHVLDKAGVKPNARYVVFQCFDSLEATLDGSGQYYESIGFEDAYHPQTILAYGMNDKTLPIAHGAPLRLRVERQLGYKMAKYVMKIELVESFAEIGRGRGSYWADRGYDWYAGI
jgi:DMSO/TMAO reductase YedYZ molybdopterin-dependent catalytic subunit